jgi:hypothetical protein
MLATRTTKPCVSQTDRGEVTERIAHTRWEPCNGQRHDQYQDHLLCASRGLATELSGDVHRFDTEGLLPYSSEYLLGFSAERYAVGLREGLEASQKRDRGQPGVSLRA